MNKGDLTCNEINCNNCPYYQNKYYMLRICLDFGKDETLYVGLENKKPYLKPSIYKELKKQLDKKVKEK